MVVLLVALVVLAAIAALAGTGLVAVARDRLAGLGVVAGTAAVLAVGIAGLVVVGVIGATIGVDGAPTRPRPAAVDPVPVDEPVVGADEPSETGVRITPAGVLRRVSLRPQPDDPFPELPPVTDDLKNGDVLDVQAAGFESFERAVARQCAVGRRRVCGPPYPVQFDEDGRARFQFRFSVPDPADDAAPCRAEGAGCELEVRGADPERVARRALAVGPASSPVRIVVRPTTGVVDGGAVSVRANGLAPGVGAVATLCVAPGTDPLSHCGSPGGVLSLEADSRGVASGTLPIESTDVGRGRHRCDDPAPCGVAVFSDDVAVRAGIVRLTFAGPAGAAYDGGRLVAGLVVAALLIGTALVLGRRTDWHPPTEADTPALDAAEMIDPFVGIDLDAEFEGEADGELGAASRAR